MTALLDTHVLIWWLNDSTRLSPTQQEVVASASAESPLLVSDISLWEVATLHSRGRIQLAIPLRAWLDKAVAPPLVRRHGISPAIAAELNASATHEVCFINVFVSHIPKHYNGWNAVS